VRDPRQDRGVEAVTIGGSRAAGTAGERSDWDVGVYYRVRIDLAPSLASERCTRPAHGAGSWTAAHGSASRGRRSACCCAISTSRCTGPAALG